MWQRVSSSDLSFSLFTRWYFHMILNGGLSEYLCLCLPWHELAAAQFNGMPQYSGAHGRISYSLSSFVSIEGSDWFTLGFIFLRIKQLAVGIRYVGR